MPAPPVLIAAHPGHELLLFHWMERTRPTVFVLTDGSGGAGTGRLDSSRACLAAAGAREGAVFGQTSDRAWYAALAAGDAGPFEAAAARILDDLAQPPALVVADPVEGYNPMHDLAAAVAGAVVLALARRGVRPRLATYALTARASGAQFQRLTLDPAARARKRAAVCAYAPLHGEAAELLATRADALDVEALIDAPGLEAWPGRLALPPLYEEIGRGRVALGRYARALTLAEHVAPVVRRLAGGAVELATAPGAAGVARSGRPG